MRKIYKSESLAGYLARKRSRVNWYSARRERRKSYFSMNLSFLKEYNEENNLGTTDSRLREMAYRFTSWEKLYVHSLENGYEDFREKVIELDYDEILELYIENEVHPSVMPSWQSEEKYSFFREKILSQLNSI